MAGDLRDSSAAQQTADAGNLLSWVPPNCASILVSWAMAPRPSYAQGKLAEGKQLSSVRPCGLL